jgi:hypothetical protein
MSPIEEGQVNSILGVGVVLGAALIVWPENAHSKTLKDAPQQQMAVTICDQAAIKSETMETAKEAASRVFHRAAIDISWTDLPAETCALPTMARAFTVIVAPQSPPDWASPDAMGFAPAGTGDRPRVYIFMNLIKEFISYFGLPTGEDRSLGIALGHAIAHELGHVLIPGDAHSMLGIMSAKWNYEHLRAAMSGTLLFIPKQEAIMRDRLRAW